MLKRLTIKNFTVFSEANLEFAAGINVVVGENGTGKSHLLKAMYAVIAAGCDPKSATTTQPTQSHLQKAYADKLVKVLRPDNLGRLARRKQGRERCEINLMFSQAEDNTALSLSTASKSEVVIETLPQQWQNKSPVFLPTKELLTLCPWFIGLYDNYHLKFEETWRDTCSLLLAPQLKGAREKQVAAMLKPLEQAMGGKVIVDELGNFYLQVKGEGKLEMPLVAEGLRKFAMLAHLISTGTLLEHGYLFWDEPETTLNPKLIKVLAGVILELANNGIQVFIATHSLFLLRELEILAGSKDYATVNKRFFGLQQKEEGVEVAQGNAIEDIGDITALEESLQQSDRYLAMSWH